MTFQNFHTQQQNVQEVTNLLKIAEFRIKELETEVAYLKRETEVKENMLKLFKENI
tara:strand:+ start:192 stop:359 length:168 start_codon:yes stop_codon:yes gene_type:complete